MEGMGKIAEDRDIRAVEEDILALEQDFLDV